MALARIQATSPAPQPHQGLYHLPPWAVPSVGKWLRNSQGSSGGLSQQEWSQKTLWPGCLACAVAQRLRCVLLPSHHCASVLGQVTEKEAIDRAAKLSHLGRGSCPVPQWKNEPNTPEL